MVLALQPELSGFGRNDGGARAETNDLHAPPVVLTHVETSPVGHGAEIMPAHLRDVFERALGDAVTNYLNEIIRHNQQPNELPIPDILD